MEILFYTLDALCKVGIFCSFVILCSILFSLKHGWGALWVLGTLFLFLLIPCMVYYGPFIIFV